MSLPPAISFATSKEHAEIEFKGSVIYLPLSLIVTTFYGLIIGLYVGLTIGLIATLITQEPMIGLFFLVVIPTGFAFLALTIASTHALGESALFVVLEMTVALVIYAIFQPKLADHFGKLAIWGWIDTILLFCLQTRIALFSAVGFFYFGYLLIIAPIFRISDDSPLESVPQSYRYMTYRDRWYKRWKALPYIFDTMAYLPLGLQLIEIIFNPKRLYALYTFPIHYLLDLHANADYYLLKKLTHE